MTGERKPFMVEVEVDYLFGPYPYPASEVSDYPNGVQPFPDAGLPSYYLLPITTLFFLILLSRSFVNIREVYSLSSIVSTISVVINSSSSIRPIIVTLLVALLNGAILL